MRDIELILNKNSKIIIKLSVIVKAADRIVLFYIIIKLSVIAKPPNP